MSSRRPTMAHLRDAAAWRPAGWSRRDRAYGVLAAACAVAFVVLSAMAVTGSGLAAFDGALATRLAAPEGPARDVAGVFAFIGDNEVMALAFALVGVAVWYTGRRAEAITLGALFLVTQGIVHALKLAFALPRPDVGSMVALGYGFPSGHTATATLCGALLAWQAGALSKRRAVRALLVVAAVAWPVAMAWSRMALGVHYISDVFGGAAVALAVSGAALPLVSMRLQRRVPVSVPLPVDARSRAEARDVPVTERRRIP